MRSCVLSTYLIVIAMLIASTDATALKRSPDAGFKASRVVAFEVVNVHEHAHDHFTQGLEFSDGRLIESSGGYGVSALIEEEIGDSRARRTRRLPAAVFAEGLTQLHGVIYQLSWREQQLFVWSRDFELLRVMPYEGEGWGLSNDGRELIMSDGSDRLLFRDPTSFAITRTLPVHENGTPLTQLNELEYARGLIFANVWQRDRIAVIDPGDGQVLAWLDLAALRARLPPDTPPRDDVLNGIAYDAARDRWFVTGKNWPRIFELRLGALPTPRAALRSPASPSAAAPPSPAR